MEILVNGLQESAGKTTAVVGLYTHLSEFGQVDLFKPSAGNDYWYDYPVVRESVEEGRLYGEDAKILSTISKQEEEKINPFHRLWAPRSVVGWGAGIGGEDQTMLLDRIYSSEENQILLLNSRASLPDDLDPLIKSADEIYKFSGGKELDEQMKDLTLPTIQSRYETFEESDFLIVESYSDTARPYSSSPDVVVTVEPGKAFLSDGEEFLRAHSLISENYRREIGARKVLKMLDSEFEYSETFRIKPITDKSPEDAASAYQEIYEGLEENYLAVD